MLHYYKPNKSNKGFACSFNYDSRTNTVYSQLIRQVSWDDTEKIGKFKDPTNNPDNKVSVKLGQVELGGIIDTIETNRGDAGFTIYHTTDNSPSKSISFKPYLKDGKQVGFSFSITQTDKQDSTKKLSWYIGFNFAEARLLKEYLVYCLNQTFLNQIQPQSKNIPNKIESNPL